MSHHRRRATNAGGVPWPYSISHTHSENDSGGTDTSWSSIPIGTAHADRVVVVAISALNSDLPTGVTIGGVSATKEAENAGGFRPACAIWSAAVSTGTTATISFSGRPWATYSQEFGVYATYPQTSSPGSMLSSGNDYNTSSGTDLSITSLEVGNEGALIYCGAYNVNGNVTATYDGADSLTEDFDGTINGSNNRSGYHGHASTSEDTSSLSLDISEGSATAKCVAVITMK